MKASQIQHKNKEIAILDLYKDERRLNRIIRQMDTKAGLVVNHRWFKQQ